MEPPRLTLSGLEALTDETGIYQHSNYGVVDRRRGYTTDDNARALIACLRYYGVFRDAEALRLANTYLSFLLFVQRPDGSFHNLLGFDRRYRDEVGSEDSMGRALWANGYLLDADVPGEMKQVAKQVFDRGLPRAYSFTSPRAMAFTILGLHHYHRAFPEDRNPS